MERRTRWTNSDVYHITESPLGYAVPGGPLDLMALPIHQLTDDEYDFVVRAIEAGEHAVRRSTEETR